MRPLMTRAGLLAGSLGFAFTCAAAMPAVAQTDSQGMNIRISDRSLKLGQPARVSGRVDSAYAGRDAVLEFRAPGSDAWTALGSAAIGGDGRFGIRRAVPQTGSVRVTIAAPTGTATASAAQSAEASISVSPRVGVSRRRLHVRAGRATTVKGLIRPGTDGVRVSLQARLRGRWMTIDRDRTEKGGRFVLRDRVRRTFSARARVVVPGYKGLSKAHRKVGRLNVYRTAYASWYGPGLYGGQLACGGTLTAGTIGVAHKTLPCGSKLTLRHRGRSVRVRVIDRGPYVGGREYDLTSATAQRIGFSGHGAILATR